MDTLRVVTETESVVSEPDVLPELTGYDLIMTPTEVAQVLRLNPEVVTRLIREGKLPGFRVGGAWRVRRSDVQAVMRGEWTPPARG